MSSTSLVFGGATYAATFLPCFPDMATGFPPTITVFLAPPPTAAPAPAAGAFVGEACAPVNSNENSNINSENQENYSFNLFPFA
jgi:hypothetical protein